MCQNGLIKKIRFISNFITWQSGSQTIVMHIFSNISRNKSNQTMNIFQLIECNTRNIFAEKSYKKCRRETSPRLVTEKLNLSISLLLYWCEYLHVFIVLHRLNPRLLVLIQRYFSVVKNYHTLHCFLHR